MTVSEIERLLNANPTSLVGIHYEAGMGELYVAEIKKERRRLIADWQAMRAVLTVIQTEPECIPHKIAEGVLFGLKLKP